MSDPWFADVRQAVRLLVKRPLFTIVAAVSIAIGVGANTTIFALANALLLRPHPGIASPHTVADVGRSIDGQGFDNVSYLNYADLRDRNDVFEGLAGFRLEPVAMSLGGRGDAERIYTTTVSGNYFDVLGVRPAAGRFFAPDEDRVVGERRAVVLSYRLWRQRFDRDPAVVGQTLLLNGQAYAVVGVAAESFRGTTIVTPDAWVPVHAVMSADTIASRRAVWLVMLGRLKPGVSIDQARAGVDVIGRALAQEYPGDNARNGFSTSLLRPLPPPATPYVSAFLALLMAMVGIILAIACVNLAGMLLASAAGRRREIAVRIAVGASRRRVIRQLLTETLVLFGAGAVMGMVLAVWMRALLLSLVPRIPVPVTFDLAFDARVGLFTLALTLTAALLTGLAPALQTSRPDLVSGLKDSAGGGRVGRLRLRNALVIGQVALSMLLLIASALLARSLRHAAAIDVGFSPRGVEIVALDLSLAGFDESRGQTFARTLESRAAALTGVRSASLSSQLPLGGGGFSLGALVLPDAETEAARNGVDADWSVVSPGYFETLQIPIVRGRGIQAVDRQPAGGSAPVARQAVAAVVNETAAARLWPGREPLGQRFRNGLAPASLEFEVVGIARNAKYRSLGEEPRLFVYVPHAQVYVPHVHLLLRRDAGPSLLPAARTLVHDLEPNLPVIEAQSLEEFISVGLLPHRVALNVAGTLGAVGVLLACIGIYGVTAYTASQRTREIGIRMALGARRGDVLRLIATQAVLLAAGGIALGAALAFAAGNLLRSLLYGVSPTDPLTFVAATGLFVVVSLAACLIPARNAARVSPVTALRSAD